MTGAPPTSPSQVPVGVDPTRPSIARIYDGFLGGKDHYEVDRAVMRKINEAVPEAVDIARGNRGFLNRACRFLATQTKIDQYLDCGSGLPTAENTHQIVQRSNPDSRVVYVDNDPVVLAHGRALLEENENVHMVEADIFTPSTVLGHEVVRRHLDFAQPLVLLHVGTLHHLEGDGGPEVMREYIDALAPGSYVVFSHFYDPQVPELTEVAKRIEDILVHGPMGAGRFRTRDEILAMLPGLEIVKPNATTDPGLVACDEWWPDGPRLTPLSKAARCIAGVVGRKP
ncbi:MULTISPECIES: SAM-dependent methyltransferase [Amycolatopsis]|uniref:O-Methyltransferase involved in polyketide biosynthesis n=2 Tax=Amycolatopsis TaxID=1813 RepID=A0A1I4BZY4_9PSEU|nr:SAM-dependent methyltransferase [Amycolatopsis sacchari]SFK74368.1 O-Methyltransferase involved in polyketide biosynthesis [Amycolatopsis sacchari]